MWRVDVEVVESIAVPMAFDVTFLSA